MPIENSWQKPKKYTKKYPHWNEEVLKELVREAWSDLSQKSINKWVKSVPGRLQDYINSEDRMTAW